MACQSIYQDLFYTKRFRNCIHCTFIFTFFCNCIVRAFFFTPLGPVEYKSFWSRTIWTTVGTLTGIIAAGQSGAESNGNEEVHHILQNWSLTVRGSLVLYPRHSFSLRMSDSSARGDNQSIQSPTNKVV